MEVHLKYMKEITDKLASIGSPITEENQVVTLLGSLPHSYSTLVTALEARADNLKLSQVQQALIQEEIKLISRSKQDVDTTEDPSFSAMVGAQGGRPWKPRCYSCGQIGHNHWDCLK